ncbi:MAG: hypothetical protein FJ096_04630 [Deltaproteobacteria bacterium]|nr:hypothetical protein [Deltaproteobacteria bacterium]
MKTNRNIVHRILSGLSLTGVATAAALVGCSDLAAPCREGNCLVTDGSSASTAGSGGAGSTSGSGSSAGGNGAGSGGHGEGGAGGEAPTPSCDPELANDPVADSCGIFVSTSLGTDSAQGQGTKALPFATLAKALDVLSTTGITTLYLCGETFEEAVVMPSGVNVYGGLECTKGWQKGSGTKSVIQGPADTIALRIVGGGSSVIRALRVKAADAKTAGASSIAMMVTDAGIDLEGVELIAGLPAKGATGVDAAGTGKDGILGIAGKGGCVNATTVVSDPGPSLTCDGGDSEGGMGGVGVNGNAAAGTAGSSTPSVTNENGGSGQQSTAGSTCSNGKPGLEGAPGTPGEGAVGIGTIGGPSGYDGVSGGPGKSYGRPGQGGGGGGGASGKLACTTTTNAGPSGGSGGTGGCGGKPGTGGQAGGSSIALVALNAKLTLANSVLSAKDGAAGGSGSGGQLGGSGFAGGAFGMGNKSHACSGGSGGNGGRGGAGGGGLGGHSLAVAYLGMAPTIDEASVTTTIAAGGLGGLGGFGGTGNVGGVGANGLAQKVFAFDPL